MKKNLITTATLATALVVSCLMPGFNVKAPDVQAKPNQTLYAGVSKELNDQISNLNISVEENVIETVKCQNEPLNVSEGYYNKCSGKTYSVEDIKYLAAGIWAEARGEDEFFQEAVGTVILNRVNADDFPNTVEGVLKQTNPLQYACYKNGQLQKAYDYYTGNCDYNTFTDKEHEIFEMCWESAVEVAMYGSGLFNEDVIFQAEFKQGSRCVAQLGNTYFCER